MTAEDRGREMGTEGRPSDRLISDFGFRISDSQCASSSIRNPQSAIRNTCPILGMAEYFRPGDTAHVEACLRALAPLGVRHVRVELIWADWQDGGMQEWYQWVIGALSLQLTVLPALAYLPPSSTSGVPIPPEDPTAFAVFFDALVDRFAGTFEWIELPSEPAQAGLWDWRLDPRGHIFSQIIASAAYRCRQKGLKTVLGGLRASDLGWLSLLCENGVVDFADAIGLREDPAAQLGTVSWGPQRGDPKGWAGAVQEARRILGEHCRNAQLWITGAGCPTDHCDEFAQCRTFAELLHADAERVYWSYLQDAEPPLVLENGFHVRLSPGCGGLLRSDGTPKLLFRLWSSQGLEGVRQCVGWASAPAGNVQKDAGQLRMADGGPGSKSGVTTLPIEEGTHPESALRNHVTPDADPGPPSEIHDRPVLITGGAGFVGSNLAERLVEAGRPVMILDNLSRAGVEHNLRYLRETYGDLLEVHIGDVRNRDLVEELAARCGRVFHFAAQVAVTTSLTDPAGDFASNLQGTLNVLEAVRRQTPPPALLFTSTNKVYGDLRDIELIPVGARHVPRDHAIRVNGVNESRPLEFHSPYGCSKGAADQYVLDYARMYGLPTVVFRMSCIYGRRQLGTEDEGWVAHFALQMLRDGALTVYGDGRQVRDILYIDDLLDAMLAATDHIQETAGKAFNIGGGPDNAVSLLDVINQLEELSGVEPQIRYGPRRKGDQSYYVSDTRRFAKVTGWTPQMGAQRGVPRLYHWILENVQPGVLELPGSEERPLATLQQKE